MTSVRRPRIALAAAVMATAALLLTACGGQEAGSAATMGDTRITEQALTTEVEAVLTAKGQPITAADPGLTSDMLGRMITIDLLDTLAERNSIVITQGMLDEQLANYDAQAGDRAAVEKLFIEQGVAPSQIESIVRLNAQAQQLGITLAPQGSAEQQGQAVVEAAVALSNELNTTVSPRYGTWNPATLKVGPVPNDLSTPPAVG